MDVMNITCGMVVLEVILSLSKNYMTSGSYFDENGVSFADTKDAEMNGLIRLQIKKISIIKYSVKAIPVKQVL